MSVWRILEGVVKAVAYVTSVWVGKESEDVDDEELDTSETGRQ